MPSQSSSELRSALREKGWHISELGMSTYCQEAKSMALNQIIQWLMNEDIKDIGDEAFPKNLKKCTTIPHNIVVQISKIRNIASPKAYHSDVAPRLLKVTLTDGHTSVAGIEYRHVNSISADTPPGTKLLLRAGKISLMGGYLLLQPSGIEILGGHVTALIDKWNISKEMQTFSRSDTGSDGPPPWIPFGQKIQRPGTHEKNFKSLDVAKPEKVDSEFEAQRQATIAEATKAQTPGAKVFGGGDRKLTDHSTQFLVDSGYSLQQVEKALRISGNNVDKALNKLQSWEKKDEFVSNEDSQQRGMGRGRKGRGAKADDAEDAHHARPSAQATLFDFLQPHIQADKKSGGSSRPSTGQNYEETQVTNRFSEMKIDERKNQQSWNNDKNEDRRGGRQDTRYERGRNDRGGEDRRYGRGRNDRGEERRYERGQNDREDRRYERGQNNRGDRRYESGQNDREDRRFERGQNDRGDRRYERGQNDREDKRYEREDRRYERGDRKQERDDKRYEREERQDDRKSVPRDDRRKQDWNTDKYNRGDRGKQTDNRIQQQQQQPPPEAYEQKSNAPYGGQRFRGEEAMLMVDVTRPPPPIKKIAVNDHVMAKYWEDGKFYRATVTGLSGPAYIVHFTEYGNTEQVYPQDIYPVQSESRTEGLTSSSDSKPFSSDGCEFSGGTLEFRRGGGKPVFRSSGRPTQQTYMPPQQRARFEY